MVQANVFDAMGQSYNALQTSMQDGARTRAGRAYSAGDREGSVNALSGAGMINEAVGLDNAYMGRDADMQERQREAQAERAQFMLRATTTLRRIPAEQRQEAYQSLRSVLATIIPPEVLAQIDAADKSDASLDAFAGALGQEAERLQPPSGYRFKGDGNLEAIPGGPASSENQRWQVTPYGLIPPPGWNPGQGAGQPEYVDELPPGARPVNPNQPAPGQPVRATSERAQTPRVSFRSSGEARSAVAQIVPGVTVTNADRTPADTERLRRQGYNPSDTSFHLRGRALDLTPPRGMTVDQLADKMRSEGFRVLNEGHHVHVSW